MSGHVEVDPGRDLRQTVSRYFAALIVISLSLGLMHVLFEDVREGGVSWFDLDRERNLATWYSGLLFFLFGASALLAYYQEVRRNADEPGLFRLPWLWLGVAAAGLYMSLDEITILHENLFWREVRIASAERSEAWKHITQWQILFAPAIALGAGYFLVFFTNRFRASGQALKSAFTGIGCWMTALLLEGIRGTFRSAGGGWYERQVVVEELLEMLGAIFLLGAIVSYVLDIALDFTAERRQRLSQVTRFLTPRALTALGIGAAVLVVSAGTIYVMAGRLAASGEPEPGLFRRALTERPPSSRPGRGVEGVWFDDLAGRQAPGEALAAAAARRAAAALFETGSRESDAALAADREARLVFLSVSDGRRQARVVRGGGKGLSAAVDAAVKAAGPVGNRSEIAWVRLDIVAEVEAEERVSFRPPLEMERGIHGLTFNREAGVAFLPDELTANDLVTTEVAVQPRRMLSYLTEHRPDRADVFRSLLKPGVPVPYRFYSTSAFFLDGKEIVPLYRGHRTWQQLDAAELLDASRRAGDYLARSVRPDGQFDYSYLPYLDAAADDYNQLRHAGTVYSMFELYAVTKDDKLRLAAERALGAMVDNFQPCPAGGREHLCPVDFGSVKLGGNALAAIALVEHIKITGDTTHRERLAPLCDWMLAVQSPAGEFTIHKQYIADGSIDDFVSAYYPGEAILALSRVYGELGDRRYLRAASKAARWLIDVRDKGKGVDELAHDHWLLYALNELYRQDNDPAFLEHAAKITEAIVTSQNRDPEWPDWLGSYYKPPRSTPTAIRTEGLAASLALARDHGDRSTVPAIRDAIDLGVRFQLQTQVGPESAMFFPDPPRAIGGFTRGLHDTEIRIDYVQHNISALLALRRILQEGG